MTTPTTSPLILGPVSQGNAAVWWAGTGVTVTGTATIAQNTWREFVVTVTNVGTPAVTLQNVGTGAYS